MKFRKKQRGFSTVELGISCTVFAAMAIITTDSMVESIRSTTKADASADTVDEARRGFDRLARDIQSADAVLARYRAGASMPVGSERDAIVLRVPEFDTTGARIPGEYLVVFYELSGGPSQSLLRRVSRWDGTRASDWGPTQRLIPGVTGLRFDYQNATQVRTGAVGSRISLPGPLVTRAPTDNQVQLLALRTRNVSIDLEELGVYVPLPIRPGAIIPVPSGLEDRDIDFRFRIDPEFVSRAPHANAANIVLVKIAAQRTVRGEGTVTRLVSRFTLRNGDH